MTAVEKTNKLALFDMFTRRKKEVPGPVRDAKEVFTFRGDKYSDDPDRQLRYLLGIVKNYSRQYAVMIIRDNSKRCEKREVLKLLNGKPAVNRLPEYSEHLAGFYLPEHLSYEVNY